MKRITVVAAALMLTALLGLTGFGGGAEPRATAPANQHSE